jgi:hypothetical protein
MKIEVEKKIDHLFRNTSDYNNLVYELEEIGNKVNNKEEFDNNMLNIWDNVVNKYIMKQPFYIYSYKSYLQKKNNEELLHIQINAKLDQIKYNEYKRQIEIDLAEKERILKNKYNDTSYMNDLRVTEKMSELYKEALVETESTLIKNPHYILDHMEKMKKKFYEYLINILEDKQMNGIKKKVMLENNYTKYMSHITGIDVLIPDELKHI